MNARTERENLQSLHHDWGICVLIAVLFVLGSFAVLSAGLGTGTALRWLALSGGIVLYQFASLWRHLSENRRAAQAPLLPNLGLANQITIARAVFVAALAGFLLIPWPRGWLAWMPGVLYLLVAVMDYMDGYVARITRRNTLLGERLDMQWDGAGVAIATVLLVLYGQAPLPYLLVGLARYLFVFGMWFRVRRGLPVYELPLSRFRRALAGSQMGFIAAILLPVFVPPATQVAALLFMLPLLVGFLRDWLAVSGGLRPAVPSGAEPSALRRKLLAAMPLAMRASLLALLGSILIEQIGQLSPLLGVLLVSLLAIPAVLLGAAGRLAALIVLLMAGFALQIAPFDLRYWLLLLFSTVLFMTGTGRLSLWKPEDWLIYHRAGE